MVDVAELGFAVDSKPVAQAAQDLDAMSKAASMADQTTKEYVSTVSRAYGATQDFSKSQVQQVRNLETQIGKQELLNAGMKRQAAQFVALRQANTTADTQYGKSVADLTGRLYDLEQQQNKTEQSGSNLANTLTRRFVVAYIISQLKQMASAVLELNNELAKVADTATRAGVGTGALQGLQSSFALKGGDSAAFLDQFLKFSQELDKAKRGVGDLASLFRLNGQAIGDSLTSFMRLSELVANATTEARKFQIIQEAGLTPSREMVKVLEQGPEAIRRQIEQSQKFTDVQLKQAQEIEERWNKAWNEWTTLGKRAVLAVGEFMQSGSLTRGLLADSPNKRAARPNIEADPGFERDFLGPAKPQITVKPRTKEETTEAISREQQYISLLGQTATALELKRQAQLTLDAAGVNGISIDSRRAEILKQMVVDQALGVTQLKAQTDASTIEAQTVGMTTGAAAQYAAIQTVILENRRRGIELQPTELDYLTKQAELMANAKLLAEGSKLTKEINELDPLVKLGTEIDNLNEKLAAGAISWDTYGRASARATANTLAGALNLGASLANSLGTIFKKQKAGAIAAAILNTAESITKTFATYGATPWGFAAAGVAAAAGLAQILTIRSTSQEGGGSVASPTGGGGGGGSSGDAGPQAPDRSISVNIIGSHFSGDQVRGLIESINEHGRDGGLKVQVS